MAEESSLKILDSEAKGSELAKIVLKNRHESIAPAVDLHYINLLKLTGLCYILFMKKKILIAIPPLVALSLFSASSYIIGRTQGYNEATRKGYEFSRCIDTGGVVGMSEPPQCTDSKGAHYAP